MLWRADWSRAVPLLVAGIFAELLSARFWQGSKLAGAGAAPRQVFLATGPSPAKLYDALCSLLHDTRFGSGLMSKSTFMGCYVAAVSHRCMLYYTEIGFTEFQQCDLQEHRQSLL